MFSIGSLSDLQLQNRQPLYVLLNQISRVYRIRSIVNGRAWKNCIGPVGDLLNYSSLADMTWRDLNFFAIHILSRFSKSIFGNGEQIIRMSPMESIHVFMHVIIGWIFACNYLLDYDITIFSNNIDDRILLLSNSPNFFRQVINKTLVSCIEDLLDHWGAGFFQRQMIECILLVNWRSILDE